MGKLKLFDDIERSDTEPARYNHSQFEYVNTTNREHFVQVRQILESWFEDYSRLNEHGALDLRNRFRLSDDRHHYGALTELYLHHLIIQNGFNASAHPDVPGTKSKPEFFALVNDSPIFAIEAVTVHNSNELARLDRFEREIKDAVDRVASADFLISIEILSRDDQNQPKLSSISSFLQSNVSNLDYNAVCAEYERSGTLPDWVWKRDSWQIRFTASPVTQEARVRRTSLSRTIGASLSPVTLVDVDLAIRDNLLSKSKKYGVMELPFVIAVNVIRESLFCDDETMLEVLYGREQTVVTVSGGKIIDSKPERDMNGVWTKPNIGLVNRHVCGILVLPVCLVPP